MIHTGRHFLQIPGPTNVPDRVLRAMDRPVIDHRGPEFAELGREVLLALRPIFPDGKRGGDIPGLRIGRVGGLNCKYSFCRRPRAHV